MAKKRPPEPVDDIPFWFVTYSDVITLLMTFFILLLTFATNEPERFERMQISMFGGAGATGFAGPSDGALEKDSLLVRVRPRSGRLTNRGSEMPPIHSDPSRESLKSGIAGLEEVEPKLEEQSHAFDLSLSLLVDREHRPTEIGRQYLRMLAQRLKRIPGYVAIDVADASKLPDAVALSTHLVEAESIQPGRVAAGVAGAGGLARGQVRLLLSRSIERTNQ